MPSFRVLKSANVVRTEHGPQCHCVYHDYLKDCIDAWLWCGTVTKFVRSKLKAVFDYELDTRISVCSQFPGEFCWNVTCRSNYERGKF